MFITQSLDQHTGAILMDRRKKYQDESHKNVTREQFFRSFSPEAARQLRRALDTSKKTQEKPHE